MSLDHDGGTAGRHDGGTGAGDPGDPGDESTGDRAAPTPIQRFAASAAGTVTAAAMRGLRDALEGPVEDEVAVVADYSGDPPFADPIVLRLDPDHPQDSIVLVRPWLRPDRS